MRYRTKLEIEASSQIFYFQTASRTLGAYNIPFIRQMNYSSHLLLHRSHGPLSVGPLSISHPKSLHSSRIFIFSLRPDDKGKWQCQLLAHLKISSPQNFHSSAKSTLARVTFRAAEKTWHVGPLSGRIDIQRPFPT